jgi:5-formyltetrahydrofolate cyclo-ligase
MSDGPPEKAERRSAMLQALRAMRPEDREAASKRVRDRLDERPEVRETPYLLAFASLGTEPDITPLLDRLRDSGRRILLPRAGNEPGSLEAVALKQPIHELEKDDLGVRVPSGGEPVPLERITTVLVPGVMFDTWGKRLGRGGGYYDRLLEQLPQAALIGVCFDASVQEDEVPTEAHDQRVDAIVTDLRTIDCAG